MKKYLNQPLAQKTMPAGIPFIVGNEGAERFSFYGMRAVLVVFMTQYLLSAGGELDVMSEEQARGWFHLFVSAVYLTPLLGAIVADVWWGKYRTIIFLSLVYCAGHVALTLDHTRLGLLIGLGLIALGAGGIKPCVSAHVGDQFAQTNQHLLARVYGWFYFSINLGAFVSMLLTPWLMAQYGPGLAFAVPGLLMFVATGLFWLGRWRFVHVPPAGKRFFTQALDREGRGALLRLVPFYLFIAVFWSLFDQSSSAWVLQAQHMDRQVFTWEVLPAQVQAANPFLVMLLIPLFSYGLYPWLSRFFELTPLRKIAIGMFLAALAFAIPSWIQWRLDGGFSPHIGWQFLAYLILTSAEVMVAITCLEYSYTRAPQALKSLVMALFMLSVSLGNLFTSLVNFLIEDAQGGVLLKGAAYYGFFTLLMLFAAIVFVMLSKRFVGKVYLQDGAPMPAPVGE